jgi:endonuclease/exonuclease/phosphatase family metal-dependent hydrolase
MRVATWNLDQLSYNATRAKRQQEEICKVDADVLVLTETHRDFTPGAGYTCHVCSSNATDLPEGGQWVAIWSKPDAEPVDLSADQKRVAAIRFIGNKAVIVGTVLPWHSSAAFQAQLAAQGASWNRLQAESGGRLCVAGDFNQDLLPTGHYFQSAESREALRAALAGCELRSLTGEADDPLREVPDRASIDHICVGKRLRAEEQQPSSVWPKPGSLLNPKEHYGVWVDIEVV